MKGMLKKALVVGVLGLGVFSVQMPSVDAASKPHTIADGAGSKKSPTYKQTKKVAKYVVRYSAPRAPFSGGGSPLNKRTFK